MKEKTVYKIEREFHSLEFLISLTNRFNAYLIENLEIDPFTEWSIYFSNIYWYLNFHLLRDGRVKLQNDEEDSFQPFYQEQNLNIIWMTVTDFENFKLKCVDGDWQIEILSQSLEINDLTSKLFNIQ